MKITLGKSKATADHPEHSTDGIDSVSDMCQASSTSRRRFVQGMALAGLGAPFLSRAASASPLNFVSYGGSYGAAVQKYLVKPFEEKTGIDVAFGVNSALAPIKVQVMSKNVQWDLAEIAGGDFIAGLKDDLFEPLDTSIIDLSNVPEYARHSHGVEYALFLSGMGYDRRQISPSDAPTNWSEFWDTSRYQGVRGLATHISDSMTLEAAQLAAGVPLDSLYPIDVELALDSLRKLGSKNTYWYEKNQEPVNFLQQQQGPLSLIASGRVAIANRNGADLGFVYNQIQLNGDYLVVPKGAKNKEEAFRLINFILTNDQAAANWMKATTYAISNTRAVSLLPEELAAKLPTSPTLQGKYFTKNFQWWGKHREDVLLKFHQFIATY